MTHIPNHIRQHASLNLYDQTWKDIEMSDKHDRLCEANSENCGCDIRKDLLEALEACLQHNINDMLEFCDMTEEETEGCGHVIQARLAISKAKGG